MNLIFVTFVEDNVTQISIPYFENHVRYFMQKVDEDKYFDST